MAQGMWTKRFTLEGSVFYYNATLNKSEWKAPMNSVTHEAEKLQIPSKEDAKNSENTIKEQQKRPLEAVVSAKETSTSPPSTKEKNDLTPADNNKSSNDSSTSDLAEQLLSSVIPLANQQKQATRQHRSKRFKSGDKNASADSDDNSAQSSYKKMVDSYQAMAGDKGDEGGKWLVR